MTKKMNVGGYRLTLLGILLFFVMMTFCTFRVSAGTIQPEPATLTTDKYDMNGDGEKDEVYEISNAAQLYWFAGLVNGTLEGEEQNSFSNGVLTKNITVNRYVLDDDKNILEGAGIDDFVSWTPIGTKDSPYQGRFDGRGYTVRGLYYEDVDSDYVGFFGCLGVMQSSEATTSDAIISNVHIRDSYFCAGQYVGGLCGYNHYGSITRSSFDGKVKGTGDVGGLCGFHTGMLTLSYNKGNVVNSGEKAGGLCGSSANGNGYVISNCYNTGDVEGYNFVGGICGYVADEETGGKWCYSSGSFTGTGTSAEKVYVDGLCGFGVGATKAILNSCYLEKDPSLCSVNGPGCSADDFANGAIAYYLAGQAGVGVWGQTLGEGGDETPVLYGETVYLSKGDSDQDVYHNHRNQDLDADGVCPYCDRYVAEPDQIGGVYQIGNAKELDWLCWYVSVGNISVDAVLTSDIAYNTNLLTKDEEGNYSLNSAPENGFRTWTPIGKKKEYQGIFDGQNHTISGLYINDDSINYAGLFGRADGSAVVKNITVSDSYVCGRDSVGMICGWSEGRIENCHSSGSVTGLSSVGGICGKNTGGTIRNCSNEAKISTNTDQYSLVAGYYAGGITGENGGNISYCSNTGTVTAASRYAGGISGIEDSVSISCCYNTGHITATADYAGGISGDYQVAISHSFNVGRVDVTNRSAGGVVGGIYAYSSVNSGNSTVTNCYYLEECCFIKGNSVTDGSAATSKSSEQFQRGEVTYLLNRDDDHEVPVWFQNIDNGFKADKHPSFTGGMVYCDETGAKYTNSVPGSHTLKYSAEGAVITETCTGTDYCGHTATATLQMDPGKNTIYTGNPIEPMKVTYSSNWQGGALTITYDNNKDISENAATATISIGEVTAILSFGIQAHEFYYATNETTLTEKCKYCDHKETAGLTMNTGANLTYTGEALTPVSVDYSDGWQGGDLEIRYDNNTKVTEQGATASISVGDITATLTFMITKADRDVPNVSIDHEETIKGKGDGRLSGLTTDMEWSADNKFYHTVTASDMEFAPGTYYIRYQENENQHVSASKKVIFVEGTNMLSVQMPEDIPSAFTLTADKTKLGWKEDVILRLTGPVNQCVCILKVNGEEIAPDSAENDENTRNYTCSKVQQDLTITLEIEDKEAPSIQFLSGNKETELKFMEPERENKEPVLFYKNRRDFFFRIVDVVSEVESVEYLLSEQNFKTEEDVVGQWKKLSPEEKGLYRISCSPGTKGYSYFRVTDTKGNQAIVNTPKMVIFEDAILNTTQITYQKESGADQSFSVDLKGNTVKAVYLGNIRINPTNYTVSVNGTVTLKNAYLETLDAKTTPYQLRIEYNPQGEIYQKLGEDVINLLGIEYTNEVPKATTLNLTVKNPSYTIEAKAGTNGSISPAGTMTVEKGTGKIFTFTPNKGYVVDTITVDGKSVKPAPTYTFSNVTGNHTIYVTFKKESQTSNPTATTVSTAQIKKNSVKLDTEITAVWKSNKLTVTWGKVSGASGYEIFAAQYGKTMNAKSLVKTVKGQTGTASFTKIGGKKPVSTKAYKVKVKAYKLVKGKKVYLGTSSSYCVVRNDNKKYTNAGKVTVKKKSVTLKKGKTSQIKASITKQSKRKKLLGRTYGPSLRYYSTNTSIATVTSKGKITAKKKGSCYVYVAALNGMHTRVKVTVK